MSTRLAYTYVLFLLVLEVLLFTASLLLHLSVFVLGPNGAYAKYGLQLFRLTVIAGVPVFAFVRDGMWMNQIKGCPKWMRKGALILGIYALLVTCMQMLFSTDISFSERAMAVSGFPIGFDAICLCILYSVLWSRCLERPEFVRRAAHSLALATVTTVVFLAYGFGYFHNLKNR